MRFEKLEGIVYLFFACFLCLSSTILLIHYSQQHAWVKLFLPIFFLLLAWTLAFYAASRWLRVRQKPTYTKIYRTYLFMQLGTFSYLTVIGIYFSFHQTPSLAIIGIGIGCIATLLTIVALYFFQKDTNKKTNLLS